MNTRAKVAAPQAQVAVSVHPVGAFGVNGTMSSDLEKRSMCCSDCRIRPLLVFIEVMPIKNVSIDAAASIMQMSTSRVRHLFKQCVGESFHKYIIATRLRQAKDWLDSTDQTVAEIADRLGVQDISHFRRDFKRVYGQSPATYRESRYSLPPHSENR
jgi:two-component system response regulator YesN